jgi:HEAT repeat protein
VLQLAGPDHATILLEGVHSELRRIQRDDTVLLLVRLGDAVIPALETALAHQRAPPRHVAAKALVLQRTDRSLRALVDAINSDDPDANEAGSYVLKELIVSGRLGPEEAFLMIQRLASSIDPATRRNAIAALTMFEETRPVRQLLDTALEDPDPGVREAAKISRNTLRDAESQSIRELLFGR